MRNIFNYVERSSPIHRLTGATKLICLLLWSFAAMTSYDTRLLAALTILSVPLFAVSRIRYSDVSFMLGFTAVFMVLNNVLVFLFAPEHGVSLYGTRHVICALGGRWVLTREQLFYHLNLVLKYLSTIPIVLLFVCTTQPSEFAASLNRIGVKYTIAYSVALALRYIPDIQREYHEISQAQQARRDEQKAAPGQAAESRERDPHPADPLEHGPHRGHLQRNGAARLRQAQKAQLVHGAALPRGRLSFDGLLRAAAGGRPAAELSQRGTFLEPLYLRQTPPRRRIGACPKDQKISGETRL